MQVNFKFDVFRFEFAVLKMFKYKDKSRKHPAKKKFTLFKFAIFEIAVDYCNFVYFPRIFLFHSGAITQHNIGSGDAAFDWRSKIPANQRPVGGATSQEEACLRSLFVSPLVWMKGKINSIVGKVNL